MLLTPAHIKPKSFESRRNSFLFFTRGGCVSCLRACLDARLLLQSYPNPNSRHWFTTSFLEGARKRCSECDPNLSEGADRVGGQLRGDKGRGPLLWRNYIWQSLEEDAGKRCSECAYNPHSEHRFPEPASSRHTFCARLTFAEVPVPLKPEDFPMP